MATQLIHSLCTQSYAQPVGETPWYFNTCKLMMGTWTDMLFGSRPNQVICCTEKTYLVSMNLKSRWAWSRVLVCREGYCNWMLKFKWSFCCLVQCFDKFYSRHSAWWTLRLYAQLLTIKPQKEGMYSHQWTCKAGQSPEIHLHSARSKFYQVGKGWLHSVEVHLHSAKHQHERCEDFIHPSLCPFMWISTKLHHMHTHSWQTQFYNLSNFLCIFTLLVFWGKDMIVINIKGVWVLISGASSPSIEHKWGGSAS